MLNLYFIRHAESEGNVNQRIVGGQSNHLQLTPRGEIQAQRLGQRLRREDIGFDQVHCSTAVRTKATCQISCQAHGFPLADIQYSDRLWELSQGHWEGQLRAECYTDAVRAQRAQDPWHFKAPGGESQKEIEERLYQWVADTLLPLQAQELCIGIYSHGFGIKALSRKILDFAPGMSYHSVIHNTSITQFQYKAGQWRFVRFNDAAHLAGTEYVGHY